MTVKQMFDSFDLQVKWCDLYVESCLLEDEAGESIFTEKEDNSSSTGIAKAIKTLFQKAKEFIAKIGDKIKQLSLEKKCEQMKKELSAHPEIGQKTVEIEDPKEKKRRLKEYEKQLNNIKKKVKSGKRISDDDRSALQKAKDFCSSPVGKVSITVAAIVAWLGLDMVDWKTRKLAAEIIRTEEEFDVASSKVDYACRGNDTDKYEAAHAATEYARMDALMKIKNANLFNRVFSNFAKWRTDQYRYTDLISKRNLNNRKKEYDDADSKFYAKYGRHTRSNASDGSFTT